MGRVKIPVIPSSEITPEHVYLNRRQFMRGVGLATGALALAACGTPIAPPPPTATPAVAGEPLTDAPAPSVPASLLPAATAEPQASRNTDELGDALTTHEAVTTYNNFYEFGLDKGDPAFLGAHLKPAPWTVEVGGLVSRPGTYGVEDLVRQFPSEERIYRLRCVEGWSMVILARLPAAQAAGGGRATEQLRAVRAVRDSRGPGPVPAPAQPVVRVALRRGAAAGRGDERSYADVRRAVRQATSAAERRAAAPGRAVEIRVQEHGIHRQDRSGGP